MSDADYQSHKMSKASLQVDPSDKGLQLTGFGLDDEEEEFFTQLRKYPCLFLSGKSRTQDVSRLRNVMHTLEGHMDNRDEEDEFTVFDPNDTTLLNFSVFILWSLRRDDEVLQKAVHAVREHPASIIAHANLAYILWMRGERTEARNELKKLEKMEADPEFAFQIAEEQATEEVVYCYSQLGFEFTDDAITTSENAITRWPENYQIKFSLAIVLKRSMHNDYANLQPGSHHVGAILRATDLFAELMYNERCGQTIRAQAAAELGNILFYQYESEIDEAVKNKRHSLGLTARDCYERALIIDGNNSSVLFKAGRFFRFDRNYRRSLELLRKAVDLRPNSRNRHQLGLTLKKMARCLRANNRRRNNNDSRNKMLNLMMKSPFDELFTPDDRNAMEAMEQFTKAVETSHRDNTYALYDLGLMYKALRENVKALDTFHQILSKNLLSQNILGAFEQSGLVFREMSLPVLGEKHTMLKKTSCVMLIMALCCQSRLVYRIRQFRSLPNTIWKSFFTLKNYIQTNCSTPSGNADSREDWLLNLIHRYAVEIPVLDVLKDIFKLNKVEAQSTHVLRAGFQEYLTAGRYEDAMLFLCLLKLTGQWQAVSVLMDVDAGLQVCVHAARNRLQEAIKYTQIDKIDKLNRQAAKWLFYWAFEERFDSVTLQQDGHQPSGLSPSSSLNDAALSSPPRCSDFTKPARAAKRRKGNDLGGSTVLLLHDPQDTTAGQGAARVQRLLERKFGLRVDCLPGDVENRTYALTMVTAMQSAAFVIIIVSNRDLSPDFEQSISSVTSTTNCTDAVDNNDTTSPPTPATKAVAIENFVVVCLEDAPLPSSLLPQRAVPCPTALFSNMSQERVDAICKFFLSLVGLENYEFTK